MTQPLNQAAPASGRVLVLGSYVADGGCEREVVAFPGFAGTVLVIDRNSATLGDRRLVAHLGSDEPQGNAALVCAGYLRDGSRGRCRALGPEDLNRDPFARSAAPVPDVYAFGDRLGSASISARARDERFRIAGIRFGRLTVLRWQRDAGAERPRDGGDPCERGDPVSLREVIGAAESYLPACALTEAAVTQFGDDPSVSVASLRSELVRLRESPIVLNRRLREVVLEVVGEGRLSMSEIALRCGRVKRDHRGNCSGETSWLARRLGIVAESGAARPTPWVHSDVLALIARAGLGVSPREVELQ